MPEILVAVVGELRIIDLNHISAREQIQDGTSHVIVVAIIGEIMPKNDTAGPDEFQGILGVASDRLVMMGPVHEREIDLPEIRPEVKLH